MLKNIDPALLALITPLFGVLIINVLNYFKTRAEAKDAMAVRIQNRNWQKEDAERIIVKAQQAIDSSNQAAVKSEAAVQAADHMTMKLMAQNDKINDLHERQLKVEEDNPTVRSTDIKDKVDVIKDISEDSNIRIKKIESR